MTGLVKGKEYKIEDSNVEKIGSKEDRAVKKKSALGEPAWKKHEQYLSGAVLTGREATKDKQGKPHHIDIWRIEKFKVIEWPRDKHGQFHTGDSYIILHTFKKEDKIAWDLHFWIGKESTQDEYGTAAYKTVELDTLLDDGPVQHRETQGYESDLFLTLFDDVLQLGGVRYLDGGMETGFKHVEPEKYKPRLLHLKGTKRVRVTDVPLQISSINAGDVFIYDAGLKIIIWTGSSAGMFEKNKAREIGAAIQTERKGKVNIINVRQGENGEDIKTFYKNLGHNGDKDPTVAAAIPDTNVDDKTLRLMRVSDASGSLTMTLEAEGNAIKKTMLDTNDAFIFDAGAQVFVWVGKKTTDQEKFRALDFGALYLKNFQRPSHLSLTRIIEGSENNIFYSLFPNTN